MAETSRSIAKKAGAAGLERALQTLMPTLLDHLNKLDERLATMDRECHGQFRELREHIDTRYEQTQQSINQLGERMARVEGTMEAYVNSINRQSDKMDQWIDRLVRVEMTQDTRRRKRAG
jgi:septal ring factor EnvC (AmiA/AmiB activator)